MQLRSFIGRIAAGIAAMFAGKAADASVPLFETSNTESGGWQECDDKPPRCELAVVEPTKTTRVKVGNLELTCEGLSVKNACLRIDGKAVPARKVILEGDIHGTWIAKIEYYPGLGEWKA